MLYPISWGEWRYAHSCASSSRTSAFRPRGSRLLWFLRFGRLCLFGIVYSLSWPLSPKRGVILCRIPTNGHLTVLLLGGFGYSWTRTYFHTSGSSRPALVIRCRSRSGISPRLSGSSLWPICHYILHKKRAGPFEPALNARTGGTPPALRLPRYFQSPKHLPLAWHATLTRTSWFYL